MEYDWIEEDDDVYLDEIDEEMDDFYYEVGIGPAELYQGEKSKNLSRIHIKKSLKLLRYKYVNSSKRHIAFLAQQVLQDRPIKFQDEHAISMTHPVYYSIDDHHKVARRKSRIAHFWANVLDDPLKEAEFYTRHPDSMLQPLSCSLRSILWDFPYREARFFEDDMEEFHEYIKEQIRMRKARRNHKKRHQTRSKKQNSKKKAKVETAHPLVATPPGDEENHMEIDPA